MKIYFRLLLLVALITGLIISCSKSDPAPAQASLPIGTWKEVSYVRTGCTDFTKNEAVNCTNCTILTVTATHVTSSGGSGPALSMSYTVSGNLVTTVPAYPETLTFTVVGTTLTLFGQSPATGSEANCKSVTTFTKI